MHVSILPVLSWRGQPIAWPFDERLVYTHKAYVDAHYDVILPPLAVAAGMGEMNRHCLVFVPHQM